MIEKDIASRLERTKLYTEQQVVEEVLEVADRSWELLEKITKIIVPGMLESDAVFAIKKLFEESKVDRIWHPVHARFGKNTILQFHQQASTDVRLQEEDIAFVDIGIVFNAVEGDVGHTLVFGDNPNYHKIQKVTEEIFEEAVAYWKKSFPTGIQLYQFIQQITEQKGFQFNLDPAGHLIGSYPHVGWKRGLSTYPKYPEPANWILEIQISDPKLNVGGFFEKILF